MCIEARLPLERLLFLCKMDMLTLQTIFSLLRRLETLQASISRVILTFRTYVYIDVYRSTLATWTSLVSLQNGYANSPNHIQFAQRIRNVTGKYFSSYTNFSNIRIYRCVSKHACHWTSLVSLQNGYPNSPNHIQFAQKIRNVTGKYFSSYTNFSSDGITC